MARSISARTLIPYNRNATIVGATTKLSESYSPFGFRLIGFRLSDRLLDLLARGALAIWQSSAWRSRSLKLDPAPLHVCFLFDRDHLPLHLGKFGCSLFVAEKAAGQKMTTAAAVAKPSLVRF